MRAASLIVGGGPAGSAAAITLARAGAAPLLIERKAGGSDTVCGGFLGWDALAVLRELGVEVEALGARRITHMRVFGATGLLETALPRPAAGLSRRVLDEALLAAAEAAGATILRGRAVRAADASTLGVRLDDGETIDCEALFLATGKYELRGLARRQSGHAAAPAVGIRAALPASPHRAEALAGVVELHLFAQGYAGLLVQEDDTVNFCLSVSRDRFRAEGSPRALVEALMREAPVLAARIGSDLPDAFESIAGVPYGWRASHTQRGVFRVGDQAAVIASLAGDGIAIALGSGRDAALAMLAQGPDAAPAWQRLFARRARLPVGIAEALRRAAGQPRVAHAALGLFGVMPFLSRAATRMTRV